MGERGKDDFLNYIFDMERTLMTQHIESSIP